jgi:hypothetical protein
MNADGHGSTRTPKLDGKFGHFSTTETLSTTEGTDFAWVNSQSIFLCIIIIVSELSGSQCFSGFQAGIHESTADFGINHLLDEFPTGYLMEIRVYPRSSVVPLLFP